MNRYQEEIATLISDYQARINKMESTLKDMAPTINGFKSGVEISIIKMCIEESVNDLKAIVARNITTESDDLSGIISESGEQQIEKNQECSIVNNDDYEGKSTRTACCSKMQRYLNDGTQTFSCTKCNSIMT